MEARTIDWEQDDDAIVTLTLDDPAGSANTINEAYIESMEPVLERLEAEKDAIAGVVLASAKRTFVAGGNLDEMLRVRPEDAAAYAERLRLIKGQLRRLETLGRPVVAAINGAALGGGLEIALAAHHRIVADDARLQLGFPEVTLGLLPGGGGVVRSVRMLGILPALTELLLSGRRLGPSEALRLGMIDEIVAPEDLVARAKAWIASGPEAVQPWDREGYEIPGDGRGEDGFAEIVAELPPNLAKPLRGGNYPAPRAIVEVAVAGARAGFDEASEIEGRHFVELITGQVAKNMIQAFFFDMQRVNGPRGARRGNAVEVRRAAIVGAGMMGAGIAYACAAAGIEAVLVDVSAAAAERGKDYSVKLVERAVEGGQRSEEEAASLLSRIHPSGEIAAIEGADLLIEAVYEDTDLKRETYVRAEPLMAPDSLLASNTSTLPISDLARGVTRPADFIGLHFFSPVDRMPLLEIVRGTETSPRSVARALDFARQIGKTPIVANDTRGFFASRVIGRFTDEGTAMLAEGIPAAAIEEASIEAGYPAPVLQLSDELNLNLIAKIRDEARAATEAEGAVWVAHPAHAVIDRMIEEFDRGGRRAGAGFYEYDHGRRTQLWPGLADAFGSSGAAEVPMRDLRERMLVIEALEAAKCHEEGVVESVAEANIGSILGIGFPGWTGGVLQYVNGYAGGPTGFVARARELAAAYGERFEPPRSLVEIAERGERYDDSVRPHASSQP